MPLTVLMPAYNSGEFIAKSIQSILSQTYADFELLVVDDGSSDSTADRVLDFRDSRIRLIRKKHTGLGSALNTGLREAKYELIARLDSDDLAMPGRLKAQTEFMKARGDSEIVSSSYYVFENRKILYKIVNPFSPAEIREELSVHSCIAHSGCMYYREKILAAGGYSEHEMEDYDLWLRLRDDAVFYNIPEALTLVRYRRGSISWSNREKSDKMHKALQLRHITGIEGTESSDILLSRARSEMHYGDMKTARNLFSKFGIFKSVRIFISFVLTLLPEKTAKRVLELRLKERLINRFKLFSKERSEALRLIKSV